MADQLRQLIKKGDPRLNVLVPKALKDLLLEAANTGKRRFQDEVIKRLSATIKAENTYKALKNIVINQVK